MTTESFSIGDRRLGPGHPCLVIAKAGVNHNGSLARAHELVDAAADAKADAVKALDDNVVLKRPMTGVDPRSWHAAKGRRAARDIPADIPIMPDMLS